MNKDLYIALLEEHVDDLNTAMKIDAVLTERKTIRMRNLENQLLSVSDWNKAQDELISKIADTAMDYQDELKDRYIEMHNEYLGKLSRSIEKTTISNAENVRLQGKIAELEKETAIEKELKREVFQLNKQNDDLRKQLNEAVREIAKLQGDKLVKEENK